jgi:hypothetical protein
MSRSAVAGADSMSAQAPSLPDTRLHGRRLALARVGWLVLVSSALALFVASLAPYTAVLHRRCVGAAACNLAGALDAAGVRGLQADGFSLSAYAASTLILTAINALLWVGLGLLLFWRRSDDGMALLAAAALVLYPVINGSGTGGVIGALALASPAWTLPVEATTILCWTGLFLFIALFPNGRFVPRWMPWVVALFLAQGIFWTFPPVESPLNANNWPIAIPSAIGIGTFVLTICSQLYRYRRSTPVERQQIKWVVFGIVLSLLLWMGVLIAEAVVVVTLPQAAARFAPLNNALWLLTSLPLPLFIALAVLRARLWDIDVLINKALVYGSLTGLLGLGYAGLIIGLASLLRLITGQAASNPLVLVVATLAIAAVVQPVRTRLQAVIDQRFYRRKYDTRQTLNAFSATLRSELDLDQLREALETVVYTTMQPAHLSLWLRLPEPPSAEPAPSVEPRRQLPSGPSPD